MSEIDDKSKNAWGYIGLQIEAKVTGFVYFEEARQFYINAEARARMAEFKAQHFEIETTRSKPGSHEHTCLAMCNYQDPCHTWTLADWERQVREGVK